jgi:hypothetical protein
MPRYAALIYGPPATSQPTSEEWQAVMADYGDFGAKPAPPA